MMKNICFHPFFLSVMVLLLSGCSTSRSDDDRSEQFTVTVALTNYNTTFDAGDTLGGTDGYSGFIEAYEDPDDVLNFNLEGDFVKLIFPSDATGPANYSLSDPFSDTFDPEQGNAAIVFLTPAFTQINGNPVSLAATSGSINFEEGGPQDTWMTGSYSATIRGVRFFGEEGQELEEEVIEGTISGDFSVLTTSSSSTIQL